MMLRLTVTALLASAAFAFPPSMSRSALSHASLAPSYRSTSEPVTAPGHTVSSSSDSALNTVQARTHADKENYENLGDKIQGGSKKEPDDLGKRNPEEPVDHADEVLNKHKPHKGPVYNPVSDPLFDEPSKDGPPTLYERAWFSNDPYTFPQAPTDRQCMREAYYLSQAGRARWKDVSPEQAICEDNLSNMIPRIAHCEAGFAAQRTSFAFPDDEMTDIKDGYRRLESYCSDHSLKLKFGEQQFVESVDAFGDRAKIIAFYEKYMELRPADGVDRYSEHAEWWPSRWAQRGEAKEWDLPDWKGGPSSAGNEKEKKWYQRVYTEAYVQSGCNEKGNSTECFCSNQGGGLVDVAREIRARKFLESPFYIIRRVEDIETWPPKSDRGEPFKDIEPLWRKAYQGLEQFCQSAGTQTLGLDFDHFARSAMDYSDELFYSPVVAFTGNEWDEYGLSVLPARENVGDSEEVLDSLVPIGANDLPHPLEASSKLPECVKVPDEKNLLTVQSPDYRINDQYGPLSEEACHDLPTLRPVRKQVLYQGPPVFRLYRPDVIIPKPAPAGFPKLSENVPEEQEQLRLGFKKDDYYDNTVIEPDNAPQTSEEDIVKYRSFIESLEPWQQVSFVVAATTWEEIHTAVLLSDGYQPWDKANALLEDPTSVVNGALMKSDLDVISLTALQVAAGAENPWRFLTQDLRDVLKENRGDSLWLKVATSPWTIQRVNNYLKVEIGEKVWQSIVELSEALDLTDDIGSV